MPISFALYPIRHVPLEPAETRWTVGIWRSGSWPGWRWLDAVEPHWGVSGTEADLIPTVLFGLAVPSIVTRRVSYRARQRTDWDVLVFEGLQDEYRPRAAVHVEHCDTRGDAERRADALWSHLLAHDGLPGG